MAVQSRWLVQGQVIITDLVGDLSLEDIQTGSQQVVDLLNESELDKVHIIGNQTEMGSIPISLKLFTEAAGFMRHPKLDWFMMYPSENQFARFMASMTSNLAGINHRQVATLEEALTVLTRLDPNLPTVEEMLALV